jgi:hypothetical protein
VAEAIERFMGPISSSLQPEADGCWVRYEDHQRLLQAVEKERDRLRRVNEQPLAAHEQLVREKEVAESKLSSVVEDKEEAQRLAIKRKRVIEETEDELEARVEGEVIVYTTNRQGATDALELLRDKGTEQGGGCEHGNTFDCPDCRLDVLELMDEGVAIEGDPGLEELLGWVEQHRDGAKVIGGWLSAAGALQEVADEIRRRLPTQQNQNNQPPQGEGGS